MLRRFEIIIEDKVWILFNELFVDSRETLGIYRLH